jgi:hypothetical protein
MLFAMRACLFRRLPSPFEPQSLQALLSLLAQVADLTQQALPLGPPREIRTFPKVSRDVTVPILLLEPNKRIEHSLPLNIGTNIYDFIEHSFPIHSAANHSGTNFASVSGIIAARRRSPCPNKPDLVEASYQVFIQLTSQLRQTLFVDPRY